VIEKKVENFWPSYRETELSRGRLIETDYVLARG